MLNTYQKFYEQPCVQTANELCEAIKFFDDFDNLKSITDQISIIKSEHIREEHVLLKSNGSTGDSVHYPFHPLFYHFRQLLENHVRNYIYDFQISSENTNIIGPHCATIANNHKLFTLDLTHKRYRDFFEEHLRKVSDDKGCQISITATPCTWVQISTNEEIYHWLLSLRPYLKSLVNTDWEFFAKDKLAQEFFINDQMIDWKTGVNFFTCSHGFKHTLPIYNYTGTHCENLLNLASPKTKCSDRISFEKATSCPCGMRRLGFDFKSHSENYLDIDRTLINSLTASYKNLQWIKNSNELILAFISNDSDDKIQSDLRYISSQIGPITTLPNHRFFVGRKRYNFWINTRNLKFSTCDEKTIHQTRLFL